MTKSTTHKPPSPPVARQQRRGGTLAVGVAAILAAGVLTACNQDIAEPILLAIVPSAAAADNATVWPRIDPLRERSNESRPSYGEISSIEPIKASSDTSSKARPVGYRIHIRLDEGGTRSIERSELNGLDVGARVRVEGGQLKQV
ncbi:hypothetical protein [Piscinibacter sakaiensis]|uniref:hypothetical protein n=1 Tax=Piscinibacter sakaiensis TaxID=1547922 RepID=UPI003AAD09CA